jgi:hypothetical protein
MIAGAALRDRGIEQLELAGLFDPWPSMADRAIDELAARGQSFDADTVREWVGDPSRPAQMGAAFLRAARRDLIERVGFRPADRSERRGAYVAVWRGTRARESA